MADAPRASVVLEASPLTAGAFVAYGDVIQSSGLAIPINQGKGFRYDDLARVDVARRHGHAAISRVRCVPEKIPVRLRLMERHPLSSQAFVPLDGQRFLVVVAAAGAAPSPETLRAFVAGGAQGINYLRGTWHHPLIALDRPCEFLEVHRAGPETNYDEAELGAVVDVVIGASVND